MIDMSASILTGSLKRSSRRGVAKNAPRHFGEIACTRYPFSFAFTSFLCKAKIVKAKLEALDKSNVANHKLLVAYAEGTMVDRTRVNMTNGLRMEEAGDCNEK
ncbi:hypothetical protein CQW23_12145 [Capsicum baccatum]|uniref:Syntaxin N-terminal domain-containing protein n=1 Tax=Capsicum baccatum TaxID=33114 RepID=A0A2G2WRS6_CAPBA|nr:hypothetical protein CQW23_12145 [Capsicum baccatum]